MKAPWKAIPEIILVAGVWSPAVAWAEGTGSVPGVAELGLRAVAALGAVLALIAALTILLRRLRASASFRPSSGRLASLGRLELGARREIRLVQVDGQMLVVGVTPERIELLSTYAAAHSSEIPAEEDEGRFPRILRKLATSS